MTILEIKKVLRKNSNTRFKIIYDAKCDECQKEFILKGGSKYFLKKEFHFYCRDCLNQSQRTGVIKQKKENIFLEKYGVKNPNQSKEVQEKYKQTCLKQYGVENLYQSKVIKEKIKITNLKRYGFEYPLQSKEVREKSKQTCLKKYGCENPMQNREISLRTSKSRNDSKVIKHWKTYEDLICTASYEIAFVNWCNKNKIDFDWQILFETPLLTENGNKSIYIIDAFIKTGEFANTYVEIKGYFKDENSHMKWDWFNKAFPNSQLWNFYRLKELGII